MSREHVVPGNNRQVSFIWCIRPNFHLAKCYKIGKVKQDILHYNIWKETVINYRVCIVGRLHDIEWKHSSCNESAHEPHHLQLLQYMWRYYEVGLARNIGPWHHSQCHLNQSSLIQQSSNIEEGLTIFCVCVLLEGSLILSPPSFT